MKTVSKTIFFGLCTFAGGVVGSSIWNMPVNGLNAGNRPAPEPVVTLTSSGDATGALNDRFEAVVHKLSPSVVSIEATKPPAPGKLKPTEESGSGVIVELEGLAGRYVITNNHVISGAKPNQIVIHFHNEKIINPTRVWVDAESDLAVMEIDASLGQPALLGDSDRSREGNWVLAFGSPFGLNRTVTHGIISARDRGQVSLGSSIRIKNFLQTDAAINPGSSGGPLVNMQGEVIGINTAIASHSGSNSGVAFAIPVNMVKRVARQLIERGAVNRGYLGVQLTEGIAAREAARLGLDEVRGALVEIVYPNTPAATAGLKVSDIILFVDDVKILNENQLINLVAAMPAGKKIAMKVWRNKQMVDVQAEVGDWQRAKTELTK